MSEIEWTIGKAPAVLLELTEAQAKGLCELMDGRVRAECERCKRIVAEELSFFGGTEPAIERVLVRLHAAMHRGCPVQPEEPP